MASNNNRIKFGIDFQVNKSGIEQARKALQGLQSIKPINFSGTQDQLRKIKETAGTLKSALENAFNTKLNTMNVDQFYNGIKKIEGGLNGAYSQLSKVGAQGRSAFNEVAASLTTTNTKLRQSSGLLQQMGTTMLNTVKWGIASSVMNTFTNSVQQAFQYVQSLDSALTDIRIVTGDSADTMARFADQANRAAQELGRSTMDYTKAALTFYQQGLNDEDVAARTEAVMKAQNITGAGQEMANYLTAVWNGYKVANEEAELYVDKLAAVADSSASNMSQLAVAMSKVASTANMLGVPVDSLNAQIATIVATTRQAPESVGNALKTIYSRINDIATGADDAQISLGNYSKKMAEVGINVLDANGKLRDTGDVIEEVGSKWDTMSREQQIYLARTMAGQRQYNNLLALFENFDKYSDLVNVSLESQGATMEKNSIYMESLAAHMQQLGAAGERVKSAMIDTDSFKGLIDFGTQAVTLFANFIESIGGGGNALLALGSIATNVFGGIISRQIGNAIVQAQTNKRIYQQMTQVMRQSSSLKLVDDGSNQNLTNYLNNLEQIHRTWSVLSQEERQAQETRAKSILQDADQIEKLKQKTVAAEQFVTTISGGKANLAQGTGIRYFIDKILPAFEEKLNTASIAYNDFRDSLDQQGSDIPETFKRLKEAFDEIEKSGIKIPEEIKNAFNSNLNDIDLDSLLQEIEKFQNSQDNIIKNVNAYKANTTAIEELKNKIKQTTNQLQIVNQQAKVVWDTQRIVKTISAIGQLASGIRALVNIFDVWNNDSLSAGEKLLQIFTSLGFTLPMLFNSFKTLISVLGVHTLQQTKINLLNEKLTALKNEQLAKQKLITAQKKVQAAQAAKIAAYQAPRDGKYNEGIRTASLGLEQAKQEKKFAEYEFTTATKNARQAENAVDSFEKRTQKMGVRVKATLRDIGLSFKQLGSSLLTLLGNPIFLITAGVTALAVVVGVTLYKAWNHAAQAAKKAEQAANSAKDRYNEIRTSVKDLTSSLEQLKEAKNTLSDLAVGTDQWRSALEEVNNQVLDLIDKYPQLKQYLVSDENGQLGFRNSGEQKYLKQLQEQQQVAQTAYLRLEKQSVDANNKSLITNISRQLGFGAGGLERAGFAWGGFNSGDLEKVVQAVQQHGNYILEDTDKLQELTGITNLQVVEIENAKEEIIKLANQVSANSEAVKAETIALTQSNLEGNQEYQSSDNQQVFAAMIAKDQLNNSFDYTKYSTDIMTSLRQMNPLDFFASLINGTLEEYYSEVSLDKDALLKGYAEAQGLREDQLYWDGEILKSVNEDLKISASIAEIKAKIASSQFYANVDYTKYNETIKQAANIFGENVNSAYKILINQSIDDINGANFSQSELDSLNNFRGNSFLQGTFKVGPADIDALWTRLKEQSEKSFTDYYNSLSKTIQSVFKRMGKDSNQDTSAAAAQALNQILTTSLEQGGIEGFRQVQDLLGQSPADETIISLYDLIDTFDWTNGTTDDFIEKIKEMGIELSGSKTDIEEFINALKETKELNPDEAYNVFQEILRKIKEGDTIDSQQYTKLIENGIPQQLLNSYFKKVRGGMYELIHSADDLRAIVDNINIEQYQQKNQNDIDEIKNREFITNQISFDESGNLNPLQGSNEFNKRGLFNAAQLLRQDNLIVAQSDLDIINKAILELEEFHSISDDSAQALTKLLEKHSEDFKQVIENTEKAKEQVLEYQQIIQDARTLEAPIDSDVNTDDLQSRTEYLMEYSRVLKGVSADLQYNKEQSEDVAESMLRMQSAVDAITKSYDDWTKALASENIEDRITAGEELQNVYADFLDLPFENLDSKFTQNAENLQLLKQALYGTEEEAAAAYDQLAMAAGQNIAEQFGNMDFSEFYNQVNQLATDILGIEIPDISVGAYIDDAQFISELNNMLNTMFDVSNATEQQAARIQAAATDMISSMGMDADLEIVDVPYDASTQQYHNMTPKIEQKELTNAFVGGVVYPTLTVPSITYDDDPFEVSGKGQQKVPALRIKNLNKSAGGNFKLRNANIAGPKNTGGGGNKGGGGSAKKPTTQKLVDASSKLKTKTPNPYEAVERSYDRQEKKLKNLDKLESKLSGKSRLTNLLNQNKALQKQNAIIAKRQEISDSPTAEGSTAWYRNQINTDEVFKDIIKFDKEGNVNTTDLKNAAVDSYNNAIEAATKTYNDYLVYYNGLSGEQQQAEKDNLEKVKDDYKNAEDAIKKSYDERIKALDNYEKALAEDVKYHEQYIANLETIIENKVKELTITIELAVDFGEVERSFREFQDTFSQWLGQNAHIRNATESIVADTKKSLDTITSYFDSGEMDKLVSNITRIETLMAGLSNASIEDGGYTDIWRQIGVSKQAYNKATKEERQNLRKQALGQLREELKEQNQQLQESMEQIAKAAEEAYQSYLDAIDNAKDAMDQHIDQYERVNSLLQHNVKLIQMMYGDKAYDSMSKYYDLQYKNSTEQLKALERQRTYWENQLKDLTPGTEEWKKVKENLDEVIDSENVKVEQIIELLGKRLENRLNKAVDSLNNRLTNGLGIDYADEEWDRINQWDDYFLDNVQSKMGIEDVTRAYEQAAADAYGNPKQVERINKLMNEQLGILKEKDNLTQYDLDRAKASLEVEKARMALEDARENKTKMRLRRDSQGNYTYQYVADEKKLSDLQQALADAQSQLYNMDKEHYQENLNQMTEVYKNYLEQMRALTEEYNQTANDQERARIQERMDALKKWANDYYEALGEDNQTILGTYLPASFAQSMGLDPTLVTVETLRESLPYVNSTLQDMVNNITGQGGLLNATQSTVKEFDKAIKAYQASVDSTLGRVKTSVEEVTAAVDSQGNALDNNVKSARALVQTYRHLKNHATTAVEKTKEMYEQITQLVKSSYFDDLNTFLQLAKDVYQQGNLVDINTQGVTLPDNVTAVTNALSKSRVTAGKQVRKATNVVNETYDDFLAKMERYNNYSANKREQANKNISIATDKLTKNLNKSSTEVLIRLLAEQMLTHIPNIAISVKKIQDQVMSSTASVINANTLNQNVRIQASFPNVNSSQEIENAFNEIINTAAQYIGKKKK